MLFFTCYRFVEFLNLFVLFWVQYKFYRGEVFPVKQNSAAKKWWKLKTFILIFRRAFPTGERVTYNGRQVLCQRCINGVQQAPVNQSPEIHQVTSTPAVPNSLPLMSSQCAGCQEELKEGQALVALDRQWHVWCFKCQACDAVLHGEYMGK